MACIEHHVSPCSKASCNIHVPLTPNTCTRGCDAFLAVACLCVPVVIELTSDFASYIYTFTPISIDIRTRGEVYAASITTAIRLGERSTRFLLRTLCGAWRSKTIEIYTIAFERFDGVARQSFIVMSGNIVKLL